MTNETRLYGVSSGNGNDGVSHMFADYYVRTNDPWRLAKLAAITEFKPEWQERAKEALEVDGEAEYTLSAVIYNPLDEDGDDWCSVNGAWRIWEIFSEDEPREGRPVYDSLEDAFGEDVALA